MACEETYPSQDYAPQIPQPFMWTEGAHAECSSVPPAQPSAQNLQQPDSSADLKTCCKCFRSRSKPSSAKRKGNWLSHYPGLDDQFGFEPGIKPDQKLLPFGLPGSSSQPFENSNCVVPRSPRGLPKRSQLKGFDV